MASVRITDGIRQHVLQRFNSMQNMRVRAQEEKIDRVLCDKTIREAMHHYEALEIVRELEQKTQQQWVYRRSDFRLRVESGSMVINTDDPVLVPKEFASTYPPAIVNVDKERHPDLYAHMEDIFQRSRAIVAEYDKLRESLVRGVLTRCTTLRQVLELWPSAIDFMPPEAVAKHREKATPRSKADQAEQMTVEDSIKATLAKERMIHGS